MPAGCTLADWMTSGTCRLQFSGLGALLSRDVTLRAVITRCPAFPEGLPDVYLDCVGADCATVFQVGAFSTFTLKGIGGGSYFAETTSMLFHFSRHVNLDHFWVYFGFEFPFFCSKEA